MKSILVILILSFFAQFTYAQNSWEPRYRFEDVTFKQKVLDADNLFKDGDVVVTRVEARVKHYMTGLGIQEHLDGYQVTLKVKDYHYAKAFYLNNFNKGPLKMKFLWDEGDFDFFQITVPAKGMSVIHFISNYHFITQSYGDPLPFSGEFLSLEIEI